MPNAWMHATIDLIAYGFPYFDKHKEKDSACKTLGSQHRIINHDWYQAYDYKVWTFDKPFPNWLNKNFKKLKYENGPDYAEEMMALTTHDYFDRVWDDLSFEQRKYCEAVFIKLLFNTRYLLEWAGVDVINGKIERVIESETIWESCPSLPFAYNKLCRYVTAVVNNDPFFKQFIIFDY